MDVCDPYWRVIKEGSISEKELQDTLKGMKPEAPHLIFEKSVGS